MIWFEQIIRFVVVYLLQILLVNNLHFMGVVDPCIYILALLALPAEVNKLWQLLIGFAAGFVMDIFCNSMGVHTLACTTLMLARPYLIGWLVQEDERLVGTISSLTLGWETYIKYVVFSTVIHHTLVFLFSAFTFRAFWLTLIQIIVSSLLTIVLLIGWEAVRKK